MPGRFNGPLRGRCGRRRRGGLCVNPPRDTSIITATSRPPRDSRINDQSDTEGTRIHLRHGGCAPGSVSGHEGSHSRAPLMTNRHTHTHTRTPDSSTSIMPHTFSLPLASPAHQPERRHPGLRERPRAPKQTSRLAAGLGGGLFTGRGRGRKSREKVDMISYCMSHRKVLQVLLLSKLILVFISLNLSALLYFHSSTS